MAQQSTAEQETAQPAAAVKPLRADARRNHERVVAAARECFGECGLEGQIDDVAARAGVGVGTVYRHFPTKEALVEQLVTDRFVQLSEFAREALDRDDPAEAFTDFMWRSARLQADDRALSQVVASVPSAMRQAAVARSELHERTAELVRRAQDVGALRDDVVTADVPMIMCGLGRIMQGEGAEWERYLAFVLDGLRAKP